MAYKKLFIDSDIIIDLLVKREPFCIYSEIIFQDKALEIELFTSALIIANVHHLLIKFTDRVKDDNLINDIVDLAKILSFTGDHIISAIKSPGKDFEDTIQSLIATENYCDIIITRNIKDYKNATIPVLTAEQFLRTVI